MAYRKRNPRVRKPKAKKSSAKGMLSMIRQVAAKVFTKKVETKYVAQQFFNGALVDTVLNTPAQLSPLIPQLDVGAQSFQRIGSRIANLRGRTIFTFWLQQDVASLDDADNIFVKLFFLESKQVKSIAQISSLTTATLLDQGDGTTTDWSNPVPGLPLIYNQMPLSNENWRGRTKILHLVKNVGYPNGNNGATLHPNTYGKVACTYVHRWYRKALTTYENGAGLTAQYPTNYAPVFGVVAYAANNAPIDRGVVQMDVRNEMYFKDA